MEYIICLLIAIIGIFSMVIWDMSKENKRLEDDLIEARKNDIRDPKTGRFKKAKD